MGRSAMTIDSPRVKAQAHLGDVAELPKSNLNIPSKMNPCTREAGGGATRRISFSLTVTVASGAATMPASSSSDSKHAEGKEIEEHGDENGKIYFYNRLSGQTAWSREELMDPYGARI